MESHDQEMNSRNYCTLGNTKSNYQMSANESASNDLLQSKHDTLHYHNAEMLMHNRMDPYCNPYRFHNGCPDHVVKNDIPEDPYHFVDEDFGQAGTSSLNYADLNVPMRPVMFPKKRGRKKKAEICNGNYSSNKIHKNESAIKERKKYDRFNGMSEDEVKQRTLPDHLAPNLDILIVGINPGLFAAYKGHHYAGPGNHFWKCLHLSGLIPNTLTAEDDHKLLEYGIGFTTLVSRTTKCFQDLNRKEIREGSQILIEKVRKYDPKIVVFNGKGIYEVFSGKKEFLFGKQPEPIDGCKSIVWVMPSSSARCAQLPRAVDKVPFYIALKKLRDCVNGLTSELDENEITFSECSLRAFADSKLEELGIKLDMKDEFENCSTKDLSDNVEVITMTNNTFLCSSETCSGDLIMELPKKKRGRPKKVHNDNGAPIESQNIKPNYKPRKIEYGPNGEPIKKKRGRPKKIRDDESEIVSNKQHSWHLTDTSNFDENQRINYANTNGMLSPLSGSTNVFSSPFNQRLGCATSCNYPQNYTIEALESRLHPQLKSPQRYGNNSVSNTDSINSEAVLSSCSSASSYHHSPPPHANTVQSSPSGHSFTQSEYSGQLPENLSSPHNLDTPPPTSPSLGPADFSPPTSISREENESKNNSSSVVQHSIPQKAADSVESFVHSQVSQSHEDQCSFSNSQTTVRTGLNVNQTMYSTFNQFQSQPTSDSDLRYSKRVNSFKDVNKRDIAPDVATKSLSGLESLVDQIPSIGDHDATSHSLTNPANNEHYSPLHAESAQSPGYASNFPTASYPSSNQFNTPVSSFSPNYSSPSTNFSISSLAHSSVSENDAPSPTTENRSNPQLHNPYSVSSLASSSSVASYYSNNVANYSTLMANPSHVMVSSGYGMGTSGSMERFVNSSQNAAALNSSMTAMGLAASAMSSMHTSSLSPYSSYSQYSSSSPAYGNPNTANFPYNTPGTFHMPNPHYPYASYATNPYQATYQNPMGFGGF